MTGAEFPSGNSRADAALAAWIDDQLADAPELDAAAADRLSRLMFGGAA